VLSPLHPSEVVDVSTRRNDKTFLAQLMLLTDWGFYYHLSRLVNSPEEYQYIQVRFILPLYGSDHYAYFMALSKLLGLPNRVSYTDINRFGFTLRRSDDFHSCQASGLFEDFLRDPARSGGFHHDPATWHTFAATRFLRFLTMASSQ